MLAVLWLGTASLFAAVDCGSFSLQRQLSASGTQSLSLPPQNPAAYSIVESRRHAGNSWNIRACRLMIYKFMQALSTPEPSISGLGECS